MTLAERVDLSPVARIPGGLLEAAYALPAGWEGGVAFLGTGCTEPEIVAPCVITDRTEIRPGDALVFEPIFINQSAACSTLSKIGAVDVAANRLESTTEWALARALATGVGSTNPSLEDAEVVTDAASVVDAVACLEQAAADSGFGAEVFLHAPMRAAAYLASEGLLTPDFLSPSGLRWIVSPGYPGSGTEISIWATGAVWASVTDAYSLVDGPASGWRHNTDAAYNQRLGLAAFDPCLNLTATFTVAACNGGS